MALHFKRVLCPEKCVLHAAFGRFASRNSRSNVIEKAFNQEV